MMFVVLKLLVLFLVFQFSVNIDFHGPNILNGKWLHLLLFGILIPENLMALSVRQLLPFLVSLNCIGWWLLIVGCYESLVFLW